jgi:hypothetical protein
MTKRKLESDMELDEENNPSKIFAFEHVNGWRTRFNKCVEPGLKGWCLCVSTVVCACERDCDCPCLVHNYDCLNA